jgi:hypothetical protein
MSESPSPKHAFDTKCNAWGNLDEELYRFKNARLRATRASRKVHESVSEASSRQRQKKKNDSEVWLKERAVNNKVLFFAACFFP